MSNTPLNKDASYLDALRRFLLDAATRFESSGCPGPQAGGRALHRAVQQRLTSSSWASPQPHPFRNLLTELHSVPAPRWVPGIEPLIDRLPWTHSARVGERERGVALAPLNDVADLADTTVGFMAIGPGDVLYNHPGDLHAVRPGDDPLLALYVLWEPSP